jgi:hypothetical protein
VCLEVESAAGAREYLNAIEPVGVERKVGWAFRQTLDPVVE